MRSIIFESHATSYDNERGIASGHLDSPLSPLGIRQAKDLGQRYREFSREVICCSDLIRSHQTAALAFEGRSVLIIKDKRLREWDYGQLTGHPAQEVETAKALYLNKPFPGGEGLKEAVARVMDFTKEIGSRYPGRNLLFIGHRVNYYAFENSFKGLSLEEILAAKWEWRPGWTYTAPEGDYCPKRI